MQKLGDHFSMFVPNGSAINSITRSNWEGSGVIPDERQSESKALPRARALLLQKWLASEPNEATRDRMRSAIEDLR